MTSDIQVLVVDDMVIARGLVRKALLEVGFKKILEASDGLKAYEILRRSDHGIGLMILDWMMPNMTGGELLEKLKKEGIAQDVPVIMVSAETEATSVLAAEAYGVKAYITKPVSQAGLIERLRRIFTELETGG